VCQATRLLEGLCPQDAVAGARVELASELVDDLRRLDGQLKEISRRLNTIVAASDTSISEVFGSARWSRPWCSGSPATCRASPTEIALPLTRGQP
jgi:hypothetical protein